MSSPHFVTIDGKRYAWREILKLRSEQRKEARQAQPPLFELKEDSRPSTQNSTRGRFEEPTLF
jgi:hypothetical protein